MISFENDYSEGASEKILQRLIETNMEQLSGYGNDRYCESAKEKIRKACGCPEAEIYFLSGGTQTNRIVISSMLQPYEGVIAAQTGHVSSHEAGAIESSGHKVLTLPQHDGKIEPEELADYLDGARLGYALAADTDVTLKDVADYCDVFYIGGTKVGALCGEAVVFTKENVPAHFLTRIKQQGGLLAKGRLLGIQFDTLFTENLYLELGRHAMKCAEKLKAIFKEKKYPFYIDSPTNQIFVVLENEKMKELEKKVKFSFWEKADDTHTVVRFAVSWATQEEMIDELQELL